MVEKARVLLVDDSPTDVKLFQVASKSTRWIKEVRTAGDGLEALELLQDSSSWRPHLILIDLNMPRMNGFELIERLKGDSKFRMIPTIVLSTSAAPQDVEKAYSLHTNCFITKPPDFTGLTDMLKVLEDYWLRVVTLPGTNAI